MAQDFSIPSATSVTKLLTSQGQDGSFGARKKLYTDLGINTRMGNWAGTASQNNALLKQLQNPAPKTSATSVLTGVLGMPKDTGMVNLNPVDFNALNMKSAAAPAKTATPATDMFGGMKTTTPSFIPPTPATPAANLVESANKDITPPQAPVTAAAVAGGAQTTEVTTPAAPAAPVDPTKSPPETNTPQVDYAKSLGITAESISGGDIPSEGSLINQFLDSEDGKALADKAQRGEIDAMGASTEAKRLLDLKYQGERTTLENNLAKSGLAFSGIRNTQLKALADNLAASELNTDRLLASKLLDADANLRDGILKGVAEIVKDAAAGRKEAIQQLNAVGLAVVNNQIVPTFAAMKEENAQIRAQAASERADAQLAISERRLQIAEQSAVLAERRFQAQYGEGRANFYSAVQDLIDHPDNTGATEQDLRLAIRQNPDVYGNPTETELNAALTLKGIPTLLQPTLAASYVANSFVQKWIDSPGNTSKSTDALNKAKDAAKLALMSSGGQLAIPQTSEGKVISTRIYNLTGDQLTALSNMIDTVSLKDVQEINKRLAAEE